MHFSEADGSSTTPTLADACIERCRAKLPEGFASGGWCSGVGRWRGEPLRAKPYIVSPGSSRRYSGKEEQAEIDAGGGGTSKITEWILEARALSGRLSNLLLGQPKAGCLFRETLHHPTSSRSYLRRGDHPWMLEACSRAGSGCATPRRRP